MSAGERPSAGWDDDDASELPADDTHSGLDSFDDYTTSFPPAEEDDTSALWEPDEPLAEESMVDTLTVTATNPARTVSATALLDGRVMEVRLEPHVARMSETELAEQIAIAARLANRQGRAAQHAFTATFMQHLGHDPSATRSFLERSLGLPSPDTVLEEKSAVFRAHHTADE